MNVPTWDYVAVHAYGEVSLIENPEEIRRQLDAMVRKYEPAGEYRLESLTEDYYQKEVRALKCFKIKVSRFEASFKLSQNRDAKNFRQVIEALEREGNDSAKAVAEWMKTIQRKDSE
jgi:transcriptional regulator